MSLILRILRAGVVVALAIGLGGWAIERRRFGASDQEALARIEAEVRERFDASAATLRDTSARVVTASAALREADRDSSQLGRLFDLVQDALPDESTGRTGITIYDAAGAPLAWGGRVSDLPRERLAGPAALFLAPGALGPRLIRVEPVVEGTGPAATRRATVVLEQSLGTVRTEPGRGDAATLSTAIAPVTIRASVGGAAAPGRAMTVTIPAPNGGALADVEIAPDGLARARSQWRQSVLAAALLVVAVTLLLCTAPFIEVRRRARQPRAFLAASAAIIALVVAARIVVHMALLPFAPTGELWSADFFLTTLALGAVVWLAVDLVERRRIAHPRAKVLPPTAPSVARVALLYFGAGVADVWLLWRYEDVIRGVVSATTLDLLHFSLHPLVAERLVVAFALVLLHAAAIWTAAAIARLPAIVHRLPRELASRPILGWVAGVLIAALVGRRLDPSVPLAPLLVAASAAGACAGALVLLRHRGRRASQSARMFALLGAVTVPAIAMYPSLFAFATDAKEGLVATQYGPQALRQRQALKDQLQQSIDEIDAMPSLADFIVGSDAETPTTDRAFLVWSRTELAVFRLTSAVELYGADGRLVSRFALNLPEYTTTPYVAPGCNWESLEEVSPFGSTERHVLRASRGLCDDRRRPLGAIVVRAMLDPRNLPFISSQSPYLESLRPNRRPQPEGVSGRDIEFVIYGWSRGPIYSAGTDVWELPGAAFRRTVESREPFWTEVDRDDETFRVYLQNDRGGIYALGYPVITWRGHLINVAELIMLAFVLHLALVVVASLFSAALLGGARSGRALLREVRSSFYHKLFLFFVAGAVAPVVILAVVTQNYFSSQLWAGAEETAARTVTTAQRLVEDYATLQQRGSNALVTIDDQIMVLVRRAVDEDVNLFERSRLQATSARDLFASQLLSMRTPGQVYRKVLIDRLPTYVGDEEVGDFRYRIAAAPVRTGGRDGIVTVPLENRRQQIEERIDELNRRVVSTAVLFSLLAAALGYWMAERIADPVSRLTRATHRIAHGDLDARIATKSSDELRRLVDDFNQMAADLKRQRTELERTQRLEAWADMARQVAHDIKNPLTPIQLSAEHLRRVNHDHGQPLSPVLDNCVDAILAQVKLLRQISAEFSSFASSPTPRPEPTSLPALVEDVVEPYRTGLTGRVAIEVHAAEALPPVTIDRTLFARALTNVIENALHAMPGSGTLTIATSEPRGSGPEPRSLVVEVIDTGVGMDPEALDKIFEPYFSTKATGTGLGLTIAKRNVELNGGTIAVRSEHGVGTTVTMTLPIS